MKFEGKCLIVREGDWMEKWNEHLYVLYYPLMSQDACTLYCLMKANCDYEITHNSLVQNSMLSEARFDNARKCLEQFLLLKTLFNPALNERRYILMPPLKPEVFLVNETYARLYMNEKGSVAYDLLKRRYLPEEEKSDAWMDISKDFDITRLEKNWSDSKERTFERMKPNHLILETYGFDFDTFFQGLNRIFPQRLRTTENLELIAQLASIHGVTAVEMRRYVQRSVNPNTFVFNKETLRNQVYNNRRIAPVGKDPYEMAPTQFLVNKQNGLPVSRQDKIMIENLVTKYQFSFEVINTLLDYVLNMTNQQLPEKYVEKVADTWTRLKVDTRQKALKAIKGAETSRKNKTAGKISTGLPEWYSRTEEEIVNPNALQEALEIQRQLNNKENKR